jgi:hypothetical protein
MAVGAQSTYVGEPATYIGEPPTCVGAPAGIVGPPLVVVGATPIHVECPPEGWRIITPVSRWPPWKFRHLPKETSYDAATAQRWQSEY